MLGKTSAESYLTFGSKNELKGVSVWKHIFLLASTGPPFVLTALFRVASIALITAWNWYIGVMVILPLACSFFIIPRAILRYFGHKVRKPNNQPLGKCYLDDLSPGDGLTSYIAELSTTSNWGRRRREKSQKLQLVIAVYFLFLYSIFLLPIIIWVDPPIAYNPDPATLRACAIAAISSGVVALPLQLLLPKILKFHS